MMDHLGERGGRGGTVDHLGGREGTVDHLVQVVDVLHHMMQREKHVSRGPQTHTMQHLLLTLCFQKL